MQSAAKLILITLLGELLVSLIPTSASAYASAPLTFCNQASSHVIVATGYHSPGVNDPADHSVLTGPFVSTGWTDIQPGTCITFPNPFNARYMFWYAVSKGFNDNEIVARSMADSPSPEKFCVTDYFGSVIRAFTFEQENVSAAACLSPSTGNANGNLWPNARLVDTWVNATVNFTGM